MAKRRQAPAQTRRLTRSEASRLGVSYSAKRRVDARIKHVTRKTKLYTDRQVAESNLARKKGVKKISREAARKTNVEERKLKRGGEVIEYKAIGKPQLMKLLRKYQDKVVIIHSYVTDLSGLYGEKALTSTQWVSGPRITARELLDKRQFERYMGEIHIEESNIETFGLIVYL
jgi:hypothetical protein